MRITNKVKAKNGTSKIEVLLTKEDELYLLQYAFNELIEKGAVAVVKDREEYLLKIQPEGNA